MRSACFIAGLVAILTTGCGVSLFSTGEKGKTETADSPEAPPPDGPDEPYVAIPLGLVCGLATTLPESADPQTPYYGCGLYEGGQKATAEITAFSVVLRRGEARYPVEKPLVAPGASPFHRIFPLPAAAGGTTDGLGAVVTATIGGTTVTTESARFDANEEATPPGPAPGPTPAPAPGSEQTVAPLTTKLLAGEEVKIVMTADVGTLIKGEGYMVRYEADKSFRVTGLQRSSQATKTFNVKGGDPSKRTLNLWGAMLTFDETGALFDSTKKKVATAQL